MPRVSIITATYNRSDVLRCAIACVRAQTFSDWEHIIVGDACTDDTAEVVAAFADPRIRFVNRATNCGEQFGPNNDGYKLATGKLIAYINHDDLWFPDHLESLVRYLDDTGADLVYALPFNIDRDGMAFCGVTNAELRYDPSHLVVGSFWLVRRELINELGGWRSPWETHASSSSQDFLTRAWQRTKDLRCHPRVTAIFLASGGRQNSYRLRDARQHEDIVRAMAEPGYRERLLTEHAMQSARKIDELAVLAKGGGARLHRAIDRFLVSLRLRPEAVRNRIARRPKGWWVDHIREFGGLSRKRPGE